MLYAATVIPHHRHALEIDGKYSQVLILKTRTENNLLTQSLACTDKDGDAFARLCASFRPQPGHLARRLQPRKTIRPSLCEKINVLD